MKRYRIIINLPFGGIFAKAFRNAGTIVVYLRDAQVESVQGAIDVLNLVLASANPPVSITLERS
jgi:hypothetical protein